MNLAAHPLIWDLVPEARHAPGWAAAPLPDADVQTVAAAPPQQGSRQGPRAAGAGDQHPRPARLVGGSSIEETKTSTLRPEGIVLRLGPAPHFMLASGDFPPRLRRRRARFPGNSLGSANPRVTASRADRRAAASPSTPSLDHKIPSRKILAGGWVALAHSF